MTFKFQMYCLYFVEESDIMGHSATSSLVKKQKHTLSSGANCFHITPNRNGALRQKKFLTFLPHKGSRILQESFPGYDHISHAKDFTVPSH